MPLPNDRRDGGVTFPTPAFIGNELCERLPDPVGGRGIARKANLRCSRDLIQSRRVQGAFIQRPVKARIALAVAEASVENEQKYQQRRSRDGKISENRHWRSRPFF